MPRDERNMWIEEYSNAFNIATDRFRIVADEIRKENERLRKGIAEFIAEQGEDEEFTLKWLKEDAN